MTDIVVRYPDPAIEVIDKSFTRYAIFNSAVERLWTGARWCEGPVWFGDARALIWSDIPNDRMLRFDETTGAVSVFRQSSNHANGNTRDRQGRLITCEHGGRRVTRTEYDGAITVVMDAYQGKRLNSPNDVVTTRDGSIWFTDPTFGIRGFYEGEKAESEIGTNVYRVDAATGEATVVVDDIDQPNGICFRRMRAVATSWNPERARAASASTMSSTEASSRMAASSSRATASRRRTVFAAISTAICGRDGVRAKAMTASACLRHRAI